MDHPIVSREARPASAAWNVLKTLVQTSVFWSLLLFLVPALIYRVEGEIGLASYRFASSTWRILGVCLFAIGGTIGLVSGTTMAIKGRGTPLPIDCPPTLVIAGPYRFVRNPMAITGLGQGAAVGLYLGSPSILAYVLTGLLVWNFGVRPGEEADLERRFGDAYRRYRARVRCWRLRWPGYDPEREPEYPALALDRTFPPCRYILLYDGHCRFCTVQVRNLLRLARPGVINAVSFQDPGVFALLPGIPYEACMRAMHLVTPDGRVFSGFEAAVRALATRPILGRLAFAYYLPGVRLGLDLVYDLIAANRYRLMGKAVAAGECDGGTCHLHVHSRPPR